MWFMYKFLGYLITFPRLQTFYSMEWNVKTEINSDCPTKHDVFLRDSLCFILVMRDAFVSGLVF
jgi:hypothetical protein